ncbi:MAG: hypothetical protein OXM87_09240 [Truepera sp.]|nr:hypothetical protein [Truepera sp.]
MLGLLPVSQLGVVTQNRAGTSQFVPFGPVGEPLSRPKSSAEPVTCSFEATVNRLNQRTVRWSTLSFTP